MTLAPLFGLTGQHPVTARIISLVVAIFLNTVSEPGWTPLDPPINFPPDAPAR
jgi:hypothetical protein